ncbi:MAG: hypothetical protein M1818_008434 [Claussenomyces sp. TS43310]|nr:MAG: hypothetical protein M1818_008434 [Claussenomyces sp. TS43310]
MSAPPALTGVRVLELAGLAPGPYAGMLLADNGASVLRIDRAIPHVTHSGRRAQPTADPLSRRKASIAVDLKSASGVDLVKMLVRQADVLIDPFRPGVLERLGLGPEVLRRLNPRLIVGRMTGFRRDGRYRDMAGHDINYIAVSGALSLLGRKAEKPLPPANILGDFAGGGAMLCQGILLALLARERSGRGQVVEANMVDGSAYLTTFPRLLLKTSKWNYPKGENALDGGAPWYDTYLTKDGKYVAVGAIEPQFFAIFLRGLGLSGHGFEESRQDRKTWPHLKVAIEKKFGEKTRSEWEQVFDGSDACVTPVLDMAELETDPAREGEQRPAVTLRETPSLAIKRSDGHRSPDEGQGRGVEGDGWTHGTLSPGQGGEQVLNQWLGWSRGKDYEVAEGGLILKRGPRL